jgi:hypothetical protein
MQRDITSKTIWARDKCNPGEGEKKPLNQIMLHIHGIRDSVVGTVTRRRVRRPRIRMKAWARGFFLHQIHSNRLWVPEKLQSNGYRVTFPEIRRSGNDVRHLTPSSVDLKNEWSYISTPPVRFQGVERVNVSLWIPIIKTR